MRAYIHTCKTIDTGFNSRPLRRWVAAATQSKRAGDSLTPRAGGWASGHISTPSGALARPNAELADAELANAERAATERAATEHTAAECAAAERAADASPCQRCTARRGSWGRVRRGTGDSLHCAATSSGRRHGTARASRTKTAS